MKPLVFVLDWDLTLGPSTWGHIRKKYGVDYDAKKIHNEAVNNVEKHHIWTRDDFSNLCEAGYTDDQLPEKIKDYRLYPGAEALIRELLAKKVDLFIVSTGFGPLINLKAQELGVPPWDILVHILRNPDGNPKCERSVLPEDKVKVVQDFQKKGKKVIFVGDGDSDIPAFQAADVAILITNPISLGRLQEKREVTDMEFPNIKSFFEHGMNGFVPTPK